jgi:peroxiredoxin
LTATRQQVYIFLAFRFSIFDETSTDRVYFSRKAGLSTWEPRFSRRYLWLMASKFLRDWWTYILVAIIVIMGVEIVYLVVQNNRLRAIIEDPKKYFKALSQNDVVPSITAQDIEGNDVSLRYSTEAPHTLLFWFSPGCSVCEDNIGVWNGIYREFGSENLRILGMCAGTPEEAREYVAVNGVEFPVISAGDRYIMETYKGNVLPQTVAISPVGAVLGVWPGVLSRTQEDEIAALLQQLQP